MDYENFQCFFSIHRSHSYENINFSGFHFFLHIFLHVSEQRWHTHTLISVIIFYQDFSFIFMEKIFLQKNKNKQLISKTDAYMNDL